MRKWLVEETGEVRIPNIGESCLYGTSIETAIMNHTSEFPILRVTEVTDKIVVVADSVERHPMSDRFDEWNW